MSSESFQVFCVRAMILASLSSCVLLLAQLAHARSEVQYLAVEPVLDMYQGEAKCVDILEWAFGDDAVIVDGLEEYSIENVCDFE